MKSRLSALIGAVILTGTLAAGCTSGSDDSGESAAASTTAASDYEVMGVAAKGDGATVTVNAAYEADMYRTYTDGSWTSGEERPTKEVDARDKGKFVVIETTIVNDTNHDMDLTCRSTGGYVDAVLQTDPEAIYQPVKRLDEIPGNPECNADLGSGFDAEMTWVFEVPEDRQAVFFNFMTDNSDEDDTTFIRLDKFGEKPSTTAREPEPTDAPDAAAVEPEADAYTPEAVPEMQEVPASAPAYGVPCSTSQLLQPATGADGTPLVCVGMGANAPARWVYGPEASGVGTASDGAACTEGEAGGQDESGRMMMCDNGQWVYGP